MTISVIYPPLTTVRLKILDHQRMN